MAILYGTTGDGTTLPVLVDQFGNLLAKGIEGAEGPQGPPGPPGVGELPPDPYEGAILGWEDGELAWVSTPVPLPAGTYGPFIYENGILQVPQLVTWLPGRDLFMSDASGNLFTYQCETDLITTVRVTGVLTTLFFPSSNNFDHFSVGEVVQSGGPAFRTTLYTGNMTARSILTGVDNTTKSLVWLKSRNSENIHYLFDTERGPNYKLTSSSTGESTELTDSLTAFLSDGFQLGTRSGVNGSDMVAWNFRATPGFMDIVTYEGTGVAGTAIPHALKSTPGVVLVKQTNSNRNWYMQHRELGPNSYLQLNNSEQKASNGSIFNSTLATDTEFFLGDLAATNESGGEYVAYLFGDTPGLIKCGTYTGTSGPQTIECGFQAGFVITKAATTSSNWYMLDSERPNKALYADASGVEQNTEVEYVPSGFTVNGAQTALNASGIEYIYVAIANQAGTSGSFASIVAIDSANNAITVDGGLWSGTDGSGDPEGQTKLEKAMSGSGTVLSTSGETIALDQDNGEWVDGYYVTSPETTVAAYKVLSEEVRRATKQDSPKT